jgi:hypothetical protein
MGLLSIDNNDAVYQSYRSAALVGLEITSLAAGGYGAVKGVIEFTKLARMPLQIARLGGRGVCGSLSKSNKIWTSTKTRTSVQNAFFHWKDHARDFPMLQNSKQCVEATKRFVHNTPTGTLAKTRPNGDIVLYHSSSNTFAIKTQSGVPRTMYCPDPLIHEFATNMEYFNAQ